MNDTLRALKAEANAAKIAYYGHKRPDTPMTIDEQIEFDMEERRLVNAHAIADDRYNMALRASMNGDDYTIADKIRDEIANGDGIDAEDDDEDEGGSFNPDEE